MGFECWIMNQGLGLLGILVRIDASGCLIKWTGRREQLREACCA